jgi:hypothetical protein
MLIAINGYGEAKLDDAANFQDLSIRADCAAADFTKMVAVIGRMDAAGYVWVSRAWLLANGRTDTAWLAGFDKMAAYAGRMGWCDPSDALRAHVVFAAEAFVLNHD